MTLRAILYARSSAADATAGKSPEELYLVPLRRQAEAAGWKIVTEGLDRHPRPDGARPELDRVSKVVNSGGAEVFATPALTHPFRSLHEMSQVLHGWEEAGIALVSLGELLDGTLPAGKARQFDLARTLWTFSRNVHSERTRAGLVLGRDNPSRGQPLVIYNPLEIKQLYERGHRGKFLSESAIVDHVKRTGGRMSKGLLTTILRNMRLAGELDDVARAKMREERGSFHNGRPVDKIGYDPEEIRSLLALGYGAMRILRSARSLPKRATFHHVRRICETVKRDFAKE